MSPFRHPALFSLACALLSFLGLLFGAVAGRGTRLAPVTCTSEADTTTGRCSARCSP